MEDFEKRHGEVIRWVNLAFLILFPIQYWFIVKPILNGVFLFKVGGDWSQPYTEAKTYFQFLVIKYEDLISVFIRIMGVISILIGEFNGFLLCEWFIGQETFPETLSWISWGWWIFWG